MRILALKTALPVHRIEQSKAWDVACQYSSGTDKQRRLVRELYRRTGIKFRHSVVPNLLADTSGAPQLFTIANSESLRGPTTAERMRLYEKEAHELGVSVALEAVRSAGIELSDISHLITISCTGFVAPGMDFEIINRLSLKRTVQRFHLGFMGCNGALNGLNLARNLIASDPKACVLLCSVELCSLHYQYGWSSSDVVANSLFADGAAAMVVSTAGSSGTEESTRQCPSSVRSSASFLIPDSADAMTWTVGNHGFYMTLSALVPDLVHEYLPEFLTGWLSEHGLRLSDISSWAVHPGGPRILRAVESSLELEAHTLEASRQIFSECGNMSSATVLFILERLIARKEQAPCIMLGFGPGCVIEAALVL